MTAEAFAEELATFFAVRNALFLGVELRLGGAFPVVFMWDVDSAMARVIACTMDKSSIHKAMLYAIYIAQEEERNGNASCGAIPFAVWPEGWSSVDG